MKRILGIGMVLGFVGALSILPMGCSKEKAPLAKKEPARKELTAKEVEEILAAMEKQMVLIPAGKFMMGPPGQEHEVTLTKPFYMGKYEVTQQQWDAIGLEKLSVVKGANLPVTNVSWIDCQEFIKKLNEKTIGGYMLPTEAEWEYACRAGTNTAYSFGNEITPKDANYVDSKIGKPVAVGSYKPNAFGLYDMHGNVWEWCEDWAEDWAESHPQESVTDPIGPATGERRRLRGGSFCYEGSAARSSNRGTGLTLFGRYHDDGFRLAKNK